MYTGNEIWGSLLNTLTSPKADDNKAQTLTKAQAIVLLIYPLSNVDFTDDPSPLYNENSKDSLDYRNRVTNDFIIETNKAKRELDEIGSPKSSIMRYVNANYNALMSYSDSIVQMRTSRKQSLLKSYEDDYQEWMFYDNLSALGLSDDSIDTIASGIKGIFNNVRSFISSLISSDEERQNEDNLDFMVSTLVIYSLYVNYPTPSMRECCKYFIGRANDILSVQNAVINKQILIISGAKGIGKKQIVKKALSSMNLLSHWITENSLTTGKNIRCLIESYLTVSKPSNRFKTICLYSESSLQYLFKSVPIIEKNVLSTEDIAYIEETISTHNAPCIVICNHCPPDNSGKFIHISIEALPNCELLRIFSQGLPDYDQYITTDTLNELFKYMLYNTALIHLLGTTLHCLSKKATFKHDMESLSKSFYRFWKLPAVAISDRQVFGDSSQRVLTYYIGEMLNISDFFSKSTAETQLLPFFIRGSIKIEYIHRWYPMDEADTAISTYEKMEYINRIDEETIELPDIISDAIWDKLTVCEKQSLLNDYEPFFNSFLNDLQQGLHSDICESTLNEVALTILYRLRDAYPKDNVARKTWNRITFITDHILIYYIFTGNEDYALKALSLIYQRLDKKRTPIKFDTYYDSFKARISCFNALLQFRKTKDTDYILRFLNQIKRKAPESKDSQGFFQAWFLLIQELMEHYIHQIECILIKDRIRYNYLNKMIKLNSSFDAFLTTKSFKSVISDSTLPEDCHHTSYYYCYLGNIHILASLYMFRNMSTDDWIENISQWLDCYTHIMNGECITFNSFSDGWLAENILLYSFTYYIHYAIRLFRNFASVFPEDISSSIKNDMKVCYERLSEISNYNTLLSNRLYNQIESVKQEYASFVDSSAANS